MLVVFEKNPAYLKMHISKFKIILQHFEPKYMFMYIHINRRLKSGRTSRNHYSAMAAGGSFIWQDRSAYKCRYMAIQHQTCVFWTSGLVFWVSGFIFWVPEPVF